MTPRGRRFLSQSVGRWGVALAFAALSVAPPAVAHTLGAADRPVPMPPAPMGKFLLVRELHRSLDDGNAIVTRRSYRINILRSGDGYVIDGELVDSVVEAPDKLAPIADLERIRPDIGLFPLRLDAAGRITGVELQPYAPTVTGTVEATNAMLQGSAMPLAQRAAIVDVVTTLANRGADDAWPPELFRPGNGERRDVRAVDAGAGGAGLVDVTVHAASTPSGWLRSFERKITTRAMGQSDETLERWTMAPLRQ